MSDNEIVRVEQAGHAGWYWVTYKDGTRRNITYRELDIIDPECNLTVELWPEQPPCPECMDHPGWMTGDRSRRHEQRDVCRACLGSGVELVMVK